MKNIKSKLITSIAVLVGCVTLLVGTSFAWFTDSITNSGNKIQAGELKISATAYDLGTGGKSYTVSGINGGKAFTFEADGQDLATVNTPIISETDWEPGKTSAKLLTVSNEDQLSAKIKLSFTTAGELTNALWYDFVQVGESGVTGTFTQREMSTLSAFAGAMEFTLKTNDSLSFIFLYGMKTSAGNEYQGKEFTADVTILATQAAVEEDGFGNSDYDSGAPLDFAPVSSAEELSEAIESGKNVSLMSDIVLTDMIAITKDMTIVGNGNSITSSAGVDRVFDLSNTSEEITVTLSGVDLAGPTTGTYTRGISFYNNSQPVKLIMDNCSASANYYAINVASANEDFEAVIRNTTITGWCAFQTHSPNVNVTFENCTLKGINDKTYNADGWNNFATIVINGYTDGNPDPNGAHDTTLTFKNCRIEATQTTGNKQFLLSVRAMGTVINVENCTFYIDGEQIDSTLEAVAPHIGVTSQEIAEDLTVNFK